MRRIQSRVRAASARRGGFTLIEMLVVMLIILVLSALIGGAIFHVMGKGPQILTLNEIQQLNDAIAAFKLDHNNIDYIPSAIVLREDCKYDLTKTASGAWNNPADVFSYYWLRKAFGQRINLVPQGTTQNGVTGTGIDWNGDGAITNTNPTSASPPTAWTPIQGHQALVLFLGGIPKGTAGTPLLPPYGTQGFSTDVTNPANVSAGTRKPYFTFESARLYQPNTTDGLLAYYHPFKQTKSSVPRQPYAYLTSYKTGNDYNYWTSLVTVPPYPTGTTWASDCASLGGLLPYKDKTGRYINPNGYQIISAGPDNQFGVLSPTGATSMWDPTKGWGPNVPGSDDLSNFSGAPLGQPQQ